jgi:hypothetical protein
VTAPSPPVAVVHTTANDAAGYVLQLTDRCRQVLLVDPVPGDHDYARALAEAVLAGLGKDPSLTCGKTGAEQMAAAWLSLGEHSDAFIVDAHLVPIVRLAPFVDMLDGFGIRAWLLLRCAGDNQRAVEDWVKLATQRHGYKTTVNELHVTFDERAVDVIGDEGDAAAVVKLPRLPAADGIVFRSACRDLLDADDFAVVDRAFVDAVNVLRDELAEVDGAHKTRSFENLLKARLVDTASDDEFVLWVRAAQVAGLCRGFHVLVNNKFLFGAIAVVPRIGKARSEHWWTELDRYREPVFAAVAALYSADISLDDIAQLTIGHITEPDGAGVVTVATSTGAAVVPAPQARFITAQRRLRQFSGAAIDGPLLGVYEPGRPRATRFVTERLSIPQADLGVKVADLQTRNRPQNVTTWLKRHGITITKLERSSTAAPIRAER